MTQSNEYEETFGRSERPYSEVDLLRMQNLTFMDRMRELLQRLDEIIDRTKYHGYEVKLRHIEEIRCDVREIEKIRS